MTAHTIMRSKFRLVLRWLCWILIAVWGMALSVWLLINVWLLPQINDLRPRIEVWVTENLGSRIQIERMDMLERGLNPAIELHNIRFLDASNKEILLVQKVVLRTSFYSFLTLRPRLEQVMIEDSNASLSRDRQGRIFLSNQLIYTPREEVQASTYLDWVLGQTEWRIKLKHLNWFDHKSVSKHATQFSDIILVLQNGHRHHLFQFDATPPLAWGNPIRVRGQFQRPLLSLNPSDFQSWHGSLYADLSNVNLRPWLTIATLGQPYVQEGSGRFQFWLNWRQAQVSNITMDFAMPRLSISPNPLANAMRDTARTLNLSKVQGRLQAIREQRGLTIKVQDLTWTDLAADVHWPKNTLQLSLTGIPQEWDNWSLISGSELPPTVGGQLQISALSLQGLSHLIKFWPTNTSLQQTWEQLQPQGVMENLRFSWQGPLEHITGYQSHGRWKGAVLRGGESPAASSWGRPGFVNADIDFEATHKSGAARIQMKQGALNFPGVFAAPVVAIDALDSEVAWTIQPENTASLNHSAAITAAKIIVKVPKFKVQTPDFKGDLQAVWHTGAAQGAEIGLGKRFPGVLNMTGQLYNAKAKAIARYLPLDVPAAARDYVNNAILDGVASKVAFKVQGDLWAFPFDSTFSATRGTFQVDADISNVALAYVPYMTNEQKLWPSVQQIQGRLRFLNNQMFLNGLKGQVFTTSVSVPEGRLLLGSVNPELKLKLQSKGAGQDLLRFVQASPIGDWLNGGLQKASMQGAVGLEVQLDLPILRPQSAQYRGFVQLQGNDFVLQPQLPSILKARGRLNFSNQEFQLVGIKGQALGSEVSIDGASHGQQGFQIGIQGKLNSAYLQKDWKSAGAQWMRFLQGETPYRLQIQSIHGRPYYRLTSSMVGMAVQLPAPFSKTAMLSQPLNIQTRPQANTDSKSKQDELIIQWGKRLQAKYLIDAAATNLRILQGGILVTDDAKPAIVDAHSLEMAAPPKATIDLEALDVDSWWKSWREFPQPESHPNASSADGMQLLPHRLQAQVKRLQVSGRVFDDVDVNLTQNAVGWDAQGQAHQFKGSAQWRWASADQPNQLMAQLTRLSLPKYEEHKDVGSSAEFTQDLPALTISVDDFEMAGKKLGRLELSAAYDVTAAEKSDTPIWRVNKLVLGHPHARLDATGHWAPKQESLVSKTELNFRIDIKNAGDLINDLGMGAVMKRGRGYLRGLVSWQGSPLDFEVRRLDGQMRMEVESGQFLKLDAGAGRLLGILSLQSLPRRLILDFRDVFLEGFAFDNISGDIQLEDGVASTNNLRMRSVQAAALLEGRADINRETQDIRVVVVPEINAGTASLAYATINPVLGLGSFLAQFFLRKPLAEANTREFHITGSWDDPQVEEMQRDDAKDSGGAAQKSQKNNSKAKKPPAK